MSTPDNLAEQWFKADDPIAAVMADVRVVSVLQQDLDKEAKRPGLNPMDAQKIDAVSWNLRERLRQADTFVDQYATAKGSPAQRGYLLGSEPKAYPEDAPLAKKMVWFAEESLRLMENIDRRLKVNQAAKAERALTVSAEKGQEPARLRNAASQILGDQPYLEHLRGAKRLPSTQMMLDDVNAQLIAQQQSRGKLQKKNPTAAAAESRSRDHQGSDSVRNSRKSPRAAAAALTTQSPVDADAGIVMSDWERNKLGEALVTLGTLSAALLRSPSVGAALTSPAPERGRSRDRTASEDRTTSVAPRARSQSPERSPSRGR